MEEKVYLNDVFTEDLCNAYDFESITEDCARIVVRAPVGAGKNYFALHGLIKICNMNKRLRQYNKILFITSRSATTEQFGKDLIKTIKEEKLDIKCARIGKTNEAIDFECESTKWQDADYIYGHKWDLENNLEEIVNMEIDKRFAFIVIDEIHSASSDDFTTASSAIYDLLSDLQSDTGVILMSACPDRASAREFEGYEAIDYNDICYKVQPKKISICQYNSAYAQARKASADNKILYFVDNKKKAYKMEKELRALGVRANAITSQPNARAEVNDNEIEIKECQRLSNDVMNEILSNERYTDEVDIIISTSKLREGVNIKDTRCKMIITELRDSISLIQCVGRVRFGVEELVIVDGTKQFVDTEYIEKIQTVEALIEIENKIVMARLQAIEETKDEEIQRLTKQIFKNYIDIIQTTYKGLVYYSVRARRFKINEFYYYEQIQRWDDFNDYKENKEEYLARVLGRDDIFNDGNEEINSALYSIFAPYIGARITGKQRQELLAQLNARLPQSKQVKQKINVIIEPLGYSCIMMPDRKTYMIESIN